MHWGGPDSTPARVRFGGDGKQPKPSALHGLTHQDCLWNNGGNSYLSRPLVRRWARRTRHSTWACDVAVARSTRRRRGTWMRWKTCAPWGHAWPRRSKLRRARAAARLYTRSWRGSNRRGRASGRCPWKPALPVGAGCCRLYATVRHGLSAGRALSHVSLPSEQWASPPTETRGTRATRLALCRSVQDNTLV